MGLAALAAGIAAGGGAAIAWPGFGRAPMLRTPEEAMRAAAEAVAGFDPADAAVSEDGRVALATGHDGRVVVVTAAGRRPRGREVGWTALRQTVEGIEVETGDRRFGTLLLRGVDALAIRRLGGLLGTVAR